MADVLKIWMRARRMVWLYSMCAMYTRDPKSPQAGLLEPLVELVEPRLLVGDEVVRPVRG